MTGAATGAGGIVSRARAKAAVVCALSALVCLGWLMIATPARAVTPAVAITSGGPLTNVWIGNELSCQISYTGDLAYELYPSSTIPGDCGTFLFAAGTLFGPDFTNHGPSAASGIGANTPFTPVSQTPVTGSGTPSSPFTVTTVVNAGATGLQIRQIDSYIAGQESYRTDVTISNTGGAPQSVILYRAGDCYLQGLDVGFGFQGPTPGAVGCSANENNVPPGRIEQWLPITGGNTWIESNYSSVWGAIGAHTPFPNTCGCSIRQDNGAGIAWTSTVAPGGSATFSHYTTFSPTGNSAPPPSGTPSGKLPPLFGRNGIVQGLPSNKVCLSKRHFDIHIRRYPGITYAIASVFLNRKAVRVKGSGGQFSALVDLRGLTAGTYQVKIIVITTTGSTISGTRTYKTCHRKAGFKGPGRL